MNYTTLSEAVKRYMAIAGLESSVEMQMQIRGVEIWKQIRNDILRLTNNQWVTVNKTILPYFIDLPKCCDKFLSIGVKDNCGKYVPLSEWDDMVITPIPEPDICTCGSGIKECIELYEQTIEPITISAGTFNKTTIKKVYENGNIYIETNTPVDKVTINGGNNGFEYVKDKQYLCKLDVKECGCIKLTQDNLGIINACCSDVTITSCKQLCNNYFNQPSHVIGLTMSETGYFKYDMKSNKIFMYGNIPDQVLVGFSTSGDNKDEEEMPSFVLDTFYSGMDYINTKYSKLKDRFEKRESERMWKESKSNLLSSLPRNQIQVNLFQENSQNIFYLWG